MIHITHRNTKQTPPGNADTTVQSMSLTDVWHSEKITKKLDPPNAQKGYADMTADWQKKAKRCP